MPRQSRNVPKSATAALAAKLQAQLEQAMALHQQGQLARAKVIYESILKTQPRHPDALHFLGIVAAQSNQHRLAIDLIDRAIAINPNDAAFYSNRAYVLQEIRQLDA